MCPVMSCPVKSVNIDSAVVHIAIHHSNKEDILEMKETGVDLQSITVHARNAAAASADSISPDIYHELVLKSVSEESTNINAYAPKAFNFTMLQLLQKQFKGKHITEDRSSEVLGIEIPALVPMVDFDPLEVSLSHKGASAFVTRNGSDWDGFINQSLDCQFKAS